MSGAEAKNLEAISLAIDQHNQSCEWPAVAVELNPFEVERARGGCDGAHVVAALGARLAQSPLVLARGLDQGKRLVAGHQAHVGARQCRDRLGRIGHQQEVLVAGGRVDRRRLRVGEHAAAGGDQCVSEDAEAGKAHSPHYA